MFRILSSLLKSARVYNYHGNRVQSNIRLTSQLCDQRKDTIEYEEKENSNVENTKDRHLEVVCEIAKPSSVKEQTSLTKVHSGAEIKESILHGASVVKQSSSDNSVDDHSLELQETENFNIERESESSNLPHLLKKRKHKPLYNLAAYVNKSPILSNLIKVGVSLAEIQKKKGAADIIVRLNYEKDVCPVLVFLKGLGIADKNIGLVLTKNPYIFKEELENLVTRVNYFKSKRFTSEMIQQIITRYPNTLSMSVERVDYILGCFQKMFELTGNEIRLAVCEYPKLLRQNKENLAERKIFFLEVLGFSIDDLKTIVVNAPRLLTIDKDFVNSNFDYIHTVMELSHIDILRSPDVLMYSQFRLKERHVYLASIGRAQYDPKQENYVSLRSLIEGSDDHFCQNVAKTSIDTFNSFLKTL